MVASRDGFDPESANDPPGGPISWLCIESAMSAYLWWEDNPLLQKRP
jgi:hypothetical protein